MEINLDELEAKCRAATPGPWVVDGNPKLNDGAPHLMTVDGYGIADFWGDESTLGLEQNCRNASYISATNPAVTLELIAQLRKAREERNKLLVALKEARDMVNDWGGHASGYFQDKYNLDGDITKLDAVIGKMAGVELP